MLKRSQVIVREITEPKGRNYKVVNHFSKIVGIDYGQRVVDLLMTMISHRERKYKEEENGNTDKRS